MGESLRRGWRPNKCGGTPSIILALPALKKEGHKFKASLDHIAGREVGKRRAGEMEGQACSETAQFPDRRSHAPYTVFQVTGTVADTSSENTRDQTRPTWPGVLPGRRLNQT